MSLLDKALVACMPLVPKFMVWPIAKRYVAGEGVEDMLPLLSKTRETGYRASVNLLGEYVETREQAILARQAYQELMPQLVPFLVPDSQPAPSGTVNVSVKPSQFGLLLDAGFCQEQIMMMAADAQRAGLFLRIEMEDTSHTSQILDMYEAVHSQYPNTGIVIQAYLRRSKADIDRILAAGEGNIRLCKGIYIEPRRLAYKDKELINRNYMLLLEAAFDQGAYVGIATHDERLVWEASRLIERKGLTPERYEFQMLLGVDTELQEMLALQGHPVRLYLPFGSQWHAYSLRRFRENPTIARYVLNQTIRELGA